MSTRPRATTGLDRARGQAFPAHPFTGRVWEGGRRDRLLLNPVTLPFPRRGEGSLDRHKPLDELFTLLCNALHDRETLLRAGGGVPDVSRGKEAGIRQVEPWHAACVSARRVLLPT